eukprot:g8014.t1
MTSGQSKMSKKEPGKVEPKRVLVRHPTDVIAEECLHNSQLEQTQTNKNATKELLHANGKMKTRANSRLAVLGEYSCDFVERQLTESYEKTLARALARVPPLCRNVLLHVKVDKIHKSIMVFTADQAQHVSHQMQNQIIMHMHDRFRGITDEQNCIKALCSANHL